MPSHYLIGALVESGQRSDTGKWLGIHTPRTCAAKQLDGGIPGPCWCRNTCQGRRPLEALPKLVETQLLHTKVDTIYIVVLFLAESPLYFFSLYLGNLVNQRKLNSKNVR